jgi:EmrB/QacA subfamily drug resistance transporter
MAFIDGSIVTIALPSIQSDLRTSFATLQWVVNAYALMLGTLILIGGGVGDRFGRRRIFLIGIGVFAIASIGCALAQDARVLIGGRIIQGIGAAFMIPQSLAIIAATFPRDVRGRAIGIWAGMSAVTTALGPPLGGFLIDTLDWHAVFWINIPISAAAVWLTIRHIPESRNENASGSLDWLGGLLAVVGFGALTLSLTEASETFAISAGVIIWLVLGIAGIIGFVVTENSVTQPLVPPVLFANKAFTGANLTTLLLYGSFSAILFLLPFDLIERRGYSASEVGFLLLPIGLVIGTLSRFSGRWADRHDARLPLIVGSFIVAFAAVLFALTIANLWAGVVTPILIMSLGMAIVVAPLTTVVMNGVSDEQSGAASGVNNAASRLSGLFAVAIVGSVAAIVFAANAGMAGETVPRFGSLPELTSPVRAALESAFIEAYSIGMLIAAVCGALAGATAYLTLDHTNAETCNPLRP